MLPPDAPPLALQPRDATIAKHAYAGDELCVLLGFALVGGSAAGGAHVRGLRVRIEGTGLDELAMARVAVPLRFDWSDPSAPGGVTPILEDGALVVSFDDVALVTARALNPDEPVPHEQGNELTLWILARPPGARTFPLRVTVATTSDDVELRATCEVVIEVLPMPRLPVLPAWVDEDWLLTVRDALARYDGREALEGWLAFDRRWDEIGDVVTSLIAAIAVASASGDGDGRCRAELRPYSARPRRFEDVTVAPDPAPGTPWFVLLEALANAGGAGTRGAHVVLHFDTTVPATRIDIWHRYDGLQWSSWDDVACPEVELVWACPRPATDEASRALGRLGADILGRAGDIAGNLGGVVFCRASPDFAHAHKYMTPYEAVAQTQHEAEKPTYLARSVRSPGHSVLVPAAMTVDVDALPAGIEARRLAHGVLLAAADEDPFTADRAPMERAVLPLVVQPSFAAAAADDDEPDGVA